MISRLRFPRRNSSWFSKQKFATAAIIVCTFLIVQFLLNLSPASTKLWPLSEGSADFTRIMFGQEQIAQDDPDLIEFVRASSVYLKPPSVEGYYLDYPDIDPSKGQSAVVKKVLQNMTNGFFVECGAFDGETRSNTLNLELHFGWKGLLIEPGRLNFEKLEQKGRKAWISNTCLATQTFPNQVPFHENSSRGRLVETLYTIQQDAPTQCLPLYTLLQAVRVATVDYFSLDVEGDELRILKTIPFDKVLIRVLSVEVPVGNPDHQKVVKTFMSRKGYRFQTLVKHRNYAHDLMFVHESVK